MEQQHQKWGETCVPAPAKSWRKKKRKTQTGLRFAENVARVTPFRSLSASLTQPPAPPFGTPCPTFLRVRARGRRDAKETPPRPPPNSAAILRPFVSISTKKKNGFNDAKLKKKVEQNNNNGKSTIHFRSSKLELIDASSTGRKRYTGTTTWYLNTYIYEYVMETSQNERSLFLNFWKISKQPHRISEVLISTIADRKTGIIRDS